MVQVVRISSLCLWLLTSFAATGIARADDAGECTTGSDAGMCDGGVEDGGGGAPLACDGGLCDTTNGASCASAGKAIGPTWIAIAIGAFALGLVPRWLRRLPAMEKSW
jgi:hypothetical protein